MEKDIATIYKITNIINGKCYIGYDSKWPRRKTQHIYLSKHRKKHDNSNKLLYKAIEKYGIENFQYEVIYQSKDFEHCLNVMEPYFIKEYKSYVATNENLGYNMTYGGDGSFGSPRPKSLEWKVNHSNVMKKSNPRFGYKYSDEEKQHHSNKMKEYYEKNPEKKPKGEKNGMFGKKHSEEWKLEHSKKIKEKYLNGEVKPREKGQCQFCKSMLNKGNIKRHENVCESNPNKKEKSKGKLTKYCKKCCLEVSKYIYNKYHKECEK